MSVLLIELGNLRSGSYRTSGSFKSVELGAEGLSEFTLAEPLGLEVRVSTTDKHTFYVSGALSYKVQGECRRCLKPVLQDCRCEIRGVYAFPEALLKVVPTEEDRENEGIYSLRPDQNSIELKDLVRESLFLDYPRYILCSETCKGLCPSCGADLSGELCDCQETSSDPRWAKLRQLKP